MKTLRTFVTNIVSLLILALVLAIITVCFVFKDSIIVPSSDVPNSMKTNESYNGISFYGGTFENKITCDDISWVLEETDNKSVIQMKSQNCLTLPDAQGRYHWMIIFSAPTSNISIANDYILIKDQRFLTANG